MPPQYNVFRFGPFEFKPQNGHLSKNGYRIKLQPKSAAILKTLLDSPGQTILREQIQMNLWSPGIHVDFTLGIKVAVKKLRDALGDSAGNPTYIKTVQGEGYRFIAPVERKVQVLEEKGDAATKEPRLVIRPVTTGASGKRWLLDAAQGVSNFRYRGTYKLLIRLSVPLLISAFALLGLKMKLDRIPAHPQSTMAQVRRYVYILDYSQNGIWGYSVNPFSGILEPIGKTPFASGEHPYQAAFSPDRAFLYVVNRGRADQVCQDGCTISAYAIDSVTGSLVELNGSPYPAGSGPVAIAIHPSGKFVYVANVISNDVHVYSRGVGGDLRPLVDRAVGARPFFVTTTPSGKFLYVGNQDDGTISAFTIGTGADMRPIQGSPFTTGLRPRSMTIDPTEHFAYVVNYGVNPYRTRQPSCEGSYGNATGKGCTISIFAIDQYTGALSQIKDSPVDSDGINPLLSTMDAGGKYLFIANITSNDISVYNVDGKTGSIHRARGSPFTSREGPASAALDWSDEYLYVVNAYSHDITQFAIDGDGGLHVLGTPVSIGRGPVAIVTQRGSMH